MEKSDYQQIKRAARRSKVSLYANVIYFVLFILVAGYLVSYIAPLVYYSKFNADIVSFKKEEKPNYLETSYTSDYSERAIYQRNWFELTQNNRLVDEMWSPPEIVPFGKEQTYQLVKRIGNQNYQIASITNSFTFNRLDSITYQDFQQVRASPVSFYEEANWNTAVSELIAYLKAKGQYSVANIQVTFPRAKKFDQVGALKAMETVTIMRYGVDYANRPAFGYPAYFYDRQTKREYTEVDFLDKLDYLIEYYEEYQHLLLDNPTNAKLPEIEENEDLKFIPASNAESPFNHFLNGYPIDFADAKDYLEQNGVKYSSLTLTGSCKDLAEWLEINKADVMQLEIQDVEDWNNAMVGRSDLDE